MRLIHINTEAPCAKMSECCQPTKDARRKWLKAEDEVYIADGRYFVRVGIATPTDSETLRQYRLNIDMKRTYLMDIVTGTLYRDDGRCLSSDQVSRTFTRKHSKQKVAA